MAFVELEIAKAHAKIDEDGESEALVKLYLGAAEEAAMEFMGRRAYPTVEALSAAVLALTAGRDPIVATDAMRAAVLLIFGQLYLHREDVVVGASIVHMPQGARSLLQPYRVGLGV